MLQSRTPARLALALLAATCLTPVAPARAAPGDPVGEEFQVNTYTYHMQRAPAVDVNANGNFVVAWESLDSSYSGIFAQRFDAAGVAEGPEFQVNTLEKGQQRLPAVAMDADGNFVVVWEGPGPDESNFDVFAQRFDAAGIALGPEIRVNTLTKKYQGYPAVAMDADGDFVVAWSGYFAPDYWNEAFARRFDATGVAQGPEFRVNTSSTASPKHTSVAMDADGEFVVVWDSHPPNILNYDIFARRFDAAGVAQGDDFRVNTVTTDYQWWPDVAMDADGDFVVTWTDYSGQDGSGVNISSQRFDRAGVAQGINFQVNTFTTGSQGHPDVAMGADGDFVLVWHSDGQDGNDLGVFARRFDAAGVPQGSEYQVNTAIIDRQWRPDIAVDADGDIVVAWESADQDGSRSGIFAQRVQGEGHVDGDFDSDGRADILWRNAGTGNNVLWRMAGFERLEAGSIGAAAAPWRVAGIADFNADYRADVLWRRDDTGNTVLWQMNGFTREAAGSIGSVSGAWRIAGLGDFNGDGRADILWRNPCRRDGDDDSITPNDDPCDGDDLGGTGNWRDPGKRNVRIWQMNGFVREAAESIGAVPRPWEVAGVGDFDGDAKADILWRNSKTGVTVIWRMDGFTKLAAQSIGAPSTSWQVAGTGDFNGDAKADILWRNAETGNTVIWRMDGFTRIAQQSIGVVNAAWTVAELRDTNGDDRADILWRNAGTGNTVLWQMDGFERVAGQSIGAPSSSWQIE